MAVMNRISPVVNLGRRPEAVIFRQNEYVYAD